MDYICIDINFSTTRMVLDKKPVIQNSNADCFQSRLFLESANPCLSDGGLRALGYFKKTTLQKPLVTIITFVFNGENFLEDTINNVISQDYDNVEYIIIDGASTDGTIDLIKKHEHAIDYWVSEKDQGIYDAINKRITLARGLEWVINAPNYRQLCQNSRNKVLKDFESTLVVNKYTELYRSVFK